MSLFRLVLAREDVTDWKAMYFHEKPEDWEGEGDPPLSAIADTYSEKLELKENQSPVMGKMLLFSFFPFFVCSLGR